MTVTERAGTGLHGSVESKVEQLLAEHDPATTASTEFLGARFDAGLAWVWFPEGHGGLGLPPELQGAVERLLRRADAPDESGRNVIGYGMAAPTVLTHGTEAQQRRWLRPLFTCEDIWCQLFSEPGAGSDVAGLATRAERDGDEWVVNGQKVWTTLAHTARWGLLLARTDPEVPKHRGMTYFVVDMHAPGVEVRALRQMTGEAEFNEVFFTDAHIPHDQRLDEVGAGWRVATTTLMNERVAIGGGVPSRASGPIHQAVEIFRSHPGRGPVARDRLMQAWVASEVQRLTNMRARQLRRAGTPGPEGSVAKLAGAELNKRVYELCVDLLGMDGTLYGSHYELVRPDTAGEARADVRHSFLRARANSIEGGTSEIMRNILGERVLGLPGEPRLDKDLPWSEVPKELMTSAPKLGAAEIRWHTQDVTTKGVRERRFDLPVDGRVVPGMLWTPAAAQGQRPLVLVGHGLTHSKSEPYVVALARVLARHHDIAAVAIDGPLHGDRRDGPVDYPVMVVEFGQRWADDPSLVDETVTDWRAVLSAVQSLPEVSEGRVGYWGLSMGTILGLSVVAAEERISVAVLGLWGLAGPGKGRLAADAANIRCPVQFLVQWDDELCPRDRQFELFDALGTADKRLHANPGAHSAVPPLEFRDTARFLADHLRPD